MAQGNYYPVLDGGLLLAYSGEEIPQAVSSVAVLGKDDSNSNENGDVLCRVLVEDLLLFTSLVYLDVSHQNLRFCDLSVLPALTELRMTHNKLVKLESPTSGFRKLKKLDLSCNLLSESALVMLGNFFQDRLVYLNISFNNLFVLPKEVCFLQKLDTLVMDNNNLGDTQLSLVGFLPSLRDLSMNHNEVTKYIHHTKIFHNLQTLFLQHNKITSLYDLSDLTKLPLLQRIELQGNNLNMEGFPMASVVGIPSFYSTNQHELFFVLEDQPTQSPKKRKKRRSKTKDEGQGIDVPAKETLFLTQVDDTLEQPDETEESVKPPVNPTEYDWIPSFILDELYSYSSKAKSRHSRRKMNTLKAVIQHPHTLHYSGATTIRKVQLPEKQEDIVVILPALEKEETAEKEEPLEKEGAEDGSISNLTEAEKALAKVKQRLMQAEQNFENTLNVDFRLYNMFNNNVQ